MIKTNDLFEQLINRKDLGSQAMQGLMEACMRGELTRAQIASFLVLMRTKGETVEELSMAASVMLDFAHAIDLGENLIDIVGTGGDGKNTFNVSTVSSFVVAAAGGRVAKHGNRSVSSRSGAADLLIHAGFRLDLSDAAFQQAMTDCGIVFLFAPHFHKAMQEVRMARQELGIRTFFNLLGPLVNPARVKRQVVGVFSPLWQQPLAQVLANLGSERALVINAQDGMDEVSISAPTEVVEYHQGHFKQWSIHPADFQCFHSSLDGILVNSPAESFRLAESVLNGEAGPARDIVLLNSALALYCAEIGSDLTDSFNRAVKAIDSGEARQCFDKLRLLTQTLT